MEENRIVMLGKDLLWPLLKSISGCFVPYKIVIQRPVHLFSDRPVIYAANHFCFADTPIMSRAVPERSYILLGRQRLRFFDRLFFFLNGVVYVDRKNKSSRAKAKDSMISYLKAGRSIVMFPEGTWNLTENLIMLPMKYGMVQIAQETGAQIVPVSLEYDRVHKLCSVCFGDPMLFEQSEDKLKAITDLRDAMATMLWDHWERKAVFQRSTMDIEAERRNLKYSIQEYPPIDWEYEKNCIYHPYTEPEDAFEHLQMLSPNRENAFLLNKRFIH